MSNVQVKNVDPELHQQLRDRAAAADMPIGEYVLELIQRDLRRPARADWLVRVRDLPTIASDVDVVAEVGAERDARDS